MSQGRYKVRLPEELDFDWVLFRLRESGAAIAVVSRRRRFVAVTAISGEVKNLLEASGARFLTDFQYNQHRTKPLGKV